MSLIGSVAHVVVLLVLPILVVGVVNRTRARWAGRKGPRLFQSAFDLGRLLRKQPVYSTTTTHMFRLAPLVVLASVLVAGLMTPVLGIGATPLSFPYDFVVVAYLWGLGRVFLMLAALDVGSSFEGMGASREATFAALLEPALFLVLGTLAIATGKTSFAEILRLEDLSLPALVIRTACLVALFIVLQVEAGRGPVDDPATHLELTMIHEVMILDHSGPDLAALQFAAAIKLTACAALVAGLANPAPGEWGLAASAAIHVALILLVAVAVGCVESLVARLRLSALPQYIVIAAIAAVIALLTTTWSQGVGG